MESENDIFQKSKIEQNSGESDSLLYDDTAGWCSYQICQCSSVADITRFDTDSDPTFYADKDLGPNFTLNIKNAFSFIKSFKTCYV